MDDGEYTPEQIKQMRIAYDLQNNLFSNPESKAHFEKSLKAHPSYKDKYQTVEEIAEPVLSPVKKELQELRAWKKSLEEKDQDAELTMTFAGMKRTYGYTDDGIAEIKKIMVERNVADPEAAAALWEKRNPPKAMNSSGYNGNSWNFNDGADEAGDVKTWFTNPDMMIEKIAMEELSKRK